MAKQKKKKLKKSILFRMLAFLCFIISLIAVFNIYRLGILPMKYFLIILLFFIFINILVFCLVKSKNWKKRMIGSFFSILFSIIIGICIFYENETLTFLNSAFASKEQIENYQILVLNSSNYGSLKEIKTGKIGVPFKDYSEGAKLMQTELKKRTSLTLQECDNSSMVESLLEKNFRAIVMEEAQKNLFMEMNDEFKENVKVLDTIQVTVKNKLKTKDLEITKTPFHVYLSGSDDYGKINQVSRSDMNMLLTVNPVTHKILLTSIPRDYYVTLSGMNGANDKLTHASLYGMETSLKTLESLLDIKIDYYVKINFSSLINLVNAVDGVEVESDTAFTASYYDEPVKKWVDYDFVEGKNYLDGKQALAFSRERKSFALGDRKRALHQQLVLNALIDKVISPSIIVNYTKILNALNGSFDTNFTYEEIISFLQNQLKKNDEWEVSSNILEGTDATARVYSMSSINTYVMKPDQESILEAQLLMNQIMNPET